jgi:hypothetical protein
LQINLTAKGEAEMSGTTIKMMRVKASNSEAANTKTKED